MPSFQINMDMAEYGGKQRKQLSKVIGDSESKDVQLKRFIDNRPQAASQMNFIRLIQKKPNNTGLPDNLKSGIENLSGYSMDDVKVHYNSDKPPQLNALAYAQGTDIHVALGQEKHLPHEAWHVVQQKQGGVQPTTQLQGVNVNDDEELEKEADVMRRATSKNIEFKSNINSENIYNRNIIQKITIRGNDSDTEDKIDHGVVYKLSSQEIRNGIEIMKKLGEYDGEKKITELVDIQFSPLNFYIGHWEAERDVKSIANEWAKCLIKAGIKTEHRLIILACESNELAKELSIAISEKGQNVKVTGALGLAYEYWWDFSSPHNHEVQIDPKHESIGKPNEGKDKTLKQWIEMRYDSLILMDMLNYLLKILNEENREKLDVDNINLLCGHLCSKEFQQFNPHDFEGPFSKNTEEKISEKGTHKISLVKLLKIPEENQCKTAKANKDRTKKIQQNDEKKVKMQTVLSSEIAKGLIYNAPDKVPFVNQHMTNLMKDWKNIEDKNKGLSNLCAYLARKCNKIWTSIAANRYVDELVSAYQGDIPNEKGGSQLKDGWITYEKGKIVSKNTHWRDITG